MQPDDSAYRAYLGLRDPESVRELYTAVRQHALAVVIGTFGPDGALQTAAEIASRVIEKLPLYRGDALFSTWVHAIARNYCADELRRKQQAASEVSLDAAQLLPATGDGLELQLELEEAMLRRLDPLEQVIMLWKLQGETVAEIARRLGIGERTVKLRLHEARESLEGVNKCNEHRKTSKCL